MFGFFSHRQDTSKQALFYVPNPDPFENPLVEINPAPLRQWTTALPFANPDQLSEAVLTSLVRLNRFPGTVRKREELMEIYQTPVQRLLHGSNTRKAPAPIHSLRRVMQEMAFGYSHIANECLSSKASKKNLDRLTHAIYKAITFYLLEYLYACEEFDCRASRSYREISRLRTYAEEQNIHLTPIVEEEKEETDDERTIEQQYNHFLLLCLLDPCHMQEGEPRICFNYLQSLAKYARFKPPHSEVDPSGHYVIDRLGEVPPSLFEPKGLDTLAHSRFTLFDINPVSKQIHQQLRCLERSEEQKPPALSKLTTHDITNLLARILKSWHIRLQRDSERHNTSGQVSLWIGLKHIFRYLTRDLEEIEMSHEQEDDEITLTHVHSPVPTHLQDPAKPQLLAQRFNQSHSGVALHLLPNQTLPPIVGELVLISLESGSSLTEWRIGVVKRALNRQEKILELGVQFVQGRIEPVTLESINTRTTDLEHDEGQMPPSHPGLYIDQGHTHRSSMIVPKHFFILGQEYRTEEMVPAPNITPLQILESTAHFERYRVKAV
jgi:hypothetical protein